MNLVLIEPGELVEGGVVLEDARSAHLRRVLRVSPGSRVRIGVVDGPIGVGIVEAIDGERVFLRCTFGEIPPVPRVDVLLALPRPKVLGRLCAALAQLGTGRLMLTGAARVERSYFDAHQLAPQYVRARLLEGLAQARDTRLPRVTIHRSLQGLLEGELDALCPGAQRLLADPGADGDLRAATVGASRALIAIGPEGGWTEGERSLLVGRGFVPVALGPRTLRTDVAAIGLVALAHDALARGA